jgi:hypothetical protein
MPTMAFLEFRLSGFASASKPHSAATAHATTGDVLHEHSKKAAATVIPFERPLVTYTLRVQRTKFIRALSSTRYLQNRAKVPAVVGS